jgi:hypothetical protein
MPIIVIIVALEAGIALKSSHHIDPCVSTRDLVGSLRRRLQDETPACTTRVSLEAASEHSLGEEASMSVFKVQKGYGFKDC